MATTYFPTGDPATLDTTTVPDITGGIPQSAQLPEALDFDLNARKAQLDQQTEIATKLDSALVDFDNFAPQANPAAKRRAITSAFVGFKLGIPPANGLAFDRQRATIARELFDGRGAESDDAFFAEIQKDAFQRKDRDTLKNSLMTESLVSQLAQAVDSTTTQEPRTSPTGIGPRDWMETVRQPRGLDVRPFETWHDQAKTLPGYDPKRAADYLSDWNLSRQLFTDRIAPFKQELYDVFNSFRDSGYSNDAAKQAYSSLPDGQHTDFLEALGLLARTLPKEEQATFWSNLKKQAARDTASNLRSIPDGARTLAMEGLAQAAGATGPIGNASPEDQAAIERRIYAERNFRADIERIAAEDYDPIKTLSAQGSWLEAVEQGAYAAPGAITYTVTAAIPYIGPAAVFSSLTDQAYTQQRRTFMDQGLTDAQASAAAADLAPIVAMPQAMLEKIGANAVLGKLPHLNRAVNALGNRVTNRVAQYGIRTAGVATFETGIEMAQDLIPDVAQDLAAALNKDLPGTDWEKTFENYGHQTLTTFVAVLPLAIIGAATNVNAEEKRRTITQASDLELTAAGFDPADVAAIRQAEQEGPASTLAAVDRAILGMDPQSETALDSTQELAETLDRQQETANRARTAGILPRFQATADGFIVTNSDNEREIGQAATAADALRLAAEHTTAIDIDDADQVAYLASLLTGAQEAAMQGTTFDGATETNTTADVRPFEEQTVAEAMAESEQQEARVLEQMAARESLGTADNTAPMAQIVLGQYQPDFSKGVRKDVLRINGGASVLTVFHEKTHQSYRTALDTGAITRDEVIGFFQSLDTILAGKTTRDGQPLQFLPTDPNQITDTLLDEAMSELMESEVLRTRKTSGKYGAPAGLVTQNLKALGRINARATGKLADFIRAIRAYFGQVFHRANLIQKGIREGQIDEAQLETFLNRVLGIDEALDFDQMAREAEAEAYGEDWTPSDTSTDEPFSIGQAPLTSASLASKLMEQIGEENLRVEQPAANYEDKRQLIFDFSESILGPDQGRAGQGDNPRGLSALQRIAHRLADKLTINPRVDFIGETIATTADLVEKAQALRNPAFETFYLFALDDGGKLLDVMALSSRCPCSAPIAEGPDQNWAGAIDQHKAFLKTAGASRYMVLHNHPSGDPSSSRADRLFTEKHAQDMETAGFEFLDHVVINHRKYASINRYGMDTGTQLLDNAETADPFVAKDWSIGAEMSSPEAAASEGRRMLAGKKLAPGELIVIATDTRLMAVGAYRTTLDGLSKLTIAQAINQGEIDGSTRLMVYGEATDFIKAGEMVSSIKKNTSADLISEIVIAQDNGQIFSGAEEGMMPFGRIAYGQDISNLPGLRVQEEASFSLGRSMPAQLESFPFARAHKRARAEEKAGNFKPGSLRGDERFDKILEEEEAREDARSAEVDAWLAEIPENQPISFPVESTDPNYYHGLKAVTRNPDPARPWRVTHWSHYPMQEWTADEEAEYEALFKWTRWNPTTHPEWEAKNARWQELAERPLREGETRLIPTGHQEFKTRREALDYAATKGEPTIGASFSLGMSGIAANLSADALGRVTDPIRRAQIMKRIARNLETIQRSAERLELTIGEKRLQKSLKNEARMRAALRQEELENEAYARHLSILADEDLATLSSQPAHNELLDPTTDKNGRRRYAGRLESRSAYIKRTGNDDSAGDYDGAEGISPMLWGGTLAPDQAAQELYEAGLINEPTTDALWDTLAREAQTVRAMKEALDRAKSDLRAAKAQATQEAQLFLDEEIGKQEVNFSPREEILRALATLDGILKGLPPEVRGKVGGYAQLARLATNEARLAFLKQRLDIADKELEKWLREQYDTELRTLLTAARPEKTEAGKRIKGKLTADVHSFFNIIREALTLSTQEAEAEARGLEALTEMDAEGNFPEVSEEIEAFVPMAANLYRVFGGWQKADAARREDAFETAQELYLRGLGMARAEAIAKREKRDRQRAGLKAATGELDNDTQKRRERLVTDTATKTGRGKQILYSLLSWEDLLRHAFGDNSPEAKLLADWERRADFAKTQAVDNKLSQLESLFADLAGSKFKGEQLRAELAAPGQVTWTDWKGKTQSVSQLEAITATLMWRQEDGRRHMQGHLNAADRPVGEWHTSQADIDAMEAQLTPEAKAVRLHLAEQYASEWERLNPVFRSLYGINMPRHKNYAPITVTSIQAAGGQVQDPLGGIGMTSTSITPGSLRNRSQTAIAEPKLSDALQVYLSHVRQMEHWMAYAEFTTEARAMLNSRAVGNAVEQRTGKEPLNVLRSWVDYFAQGGVIDASAHLAINGLFQRMISRASSMALVGRVSVLAIQSTQLGAAAYEMPTGDYIKRFAKLMSGNLQWGDAMKSDYIKRRLSQMPAVVQQGLQGLKGGKPTRIRYAMRQVGELIGGADALFTAGTYAILLDYHRTKGSAEFGLKGQQLESYAHNAAARTTDRVAQPTRAGGRSFYEVTSTNPAMKMVWAFASEPRQKLAITAAAYLRGDKKAAARSAIITWLFSGLVAAVIRAAVRDVRNGEDDEVFDEKNWDPKRLALSSLTGPAAGLPILGNAAESLLFAMAGEYLPDGNLLDSGTRAATSAQNLPDYLDGEKSMEDAIKDIEAILTGMGLVSNEAAAYTSAMHIVRDFWGFLTNWTD